MRKSLFTEAQIIGILKQAAAGPRATASGLLSTVVAVSETHSVNNPPS